MPPRIRWGALRLMLLATATAGAPAVVAQAAPQDVGPSVAGRIVRLDPRFDRLVPPGATVDTVVAGHTWVEGPLWDRRAGALLFSDVPQNAVYRWKPDSGETVLLQPSGYSGLARFTGPEPGSNGLGFDALGRLLLCEHGDRRIARLEPDGRQTTVVDRYEGRRLNSPNDLVVRANGDLVFTDPPFGLPKTFDDPAKELDFQGVYRVSGDGRLSVLTRDLRAPNGLAFSPDGKTMYVSEADLTHAVWYAFAVRPDGTLGPGRVIFDATRWVPDRKGVPDGLKLDRDGNIFAAGPGAVYVLAPDGAHLGTIQTGSATGNVGWGGDGSDLFIMAKTAVLRVRTATKGQGF